MEHLNAVSLTFTRESYYWTKCIHKYFLILNRIQAVSFHVSKIPILSVVLLTLLVLVNISWAICCRQICFGSQETVKELKYYLPPSYSTVDLHTLGLSVHVYLNPTPEYPGNNLQYLDLEAGNYRVSRLSLNSTDGITPRLGRLGVASCKSCSSESVVVLPRSARFPVLSDSLTTSWRRESSCSRNSRVSFSEDVEYSSGSLRWLSSNTLFRKIDK